MLFYEIKRLSIDSAEMRTGADDFVKNTTRAVEISTPSDIILRSREAVS